MPLKTPQHRDGFRISSGATGKSDGPKLLEDHISDYDLDVEDLRAFLKKKYPELDWTSPTSSYVKLPPSASTALLSCYAMRLLGVKADSSPEQEQ